MKNLNTTIKANSQKPPQTLLVLLIKGLSRRPTFTSKCNPNLAGPESVQKQYQDPQPNQPLLYTVQVGTDPPLGRNYRKFTPVPRIQPSQW
jgi:hypothetical protein